MVLTFNCNFLRMTCKRVFFFKFPQANQIGYESNGGNLMTVTIMDSDSSKLRYITLIVFAVPISALKSPPGIDMKDVQWLMAGLSKKPEVLPEKRNKRLKEDAFQRHSLSFFSRWNHMWYMIWVSIWYDKIWYIISYDTIRYNLI